MKLKEFLLAILIAAGSLQAQVGIGTKVPKASSMSREILE